MVTSLSRALLRSSSLIILISTPLVLASSARATEPLDVVVTADRANVPLKNTGSAITVISSEDIEKYGSKNIADVLRTVPGLTLAETGGLGGATSVSLRGASAAETMVLLDGIRISDPSNTESYLDFGNFSAANIERIEVLRGPQSSLYGSDAMGGVINIITKKGQRTPVREVTVEAGSYGTYVARGAMSGATDTVTYAFGVNALHSDGFPRYGYRVSGDPFPFLSPKPELKDNPVNKSGLNGQVSYRVNETITVETGLSYFSNRLQFPDPYASDPANVYNSNNHSRADILNGFVRARFSAFDEVLKNQMTVFGNQTDRDSWQMELYGCANVKGPCRSGYFGKRFGLEYQGDLNLGAMGNLTFGGRRETESMRTDQDPSAGFSSIDASQSTNSVFAQHRVDLSNRLSLSFGGRIDAVENGKTFPTWRSTFAYQLDETATKFRASVGTGAKAPTLYQRFSEYGTPDLQPEKSTSVDFGFDQSLADGRANFSMTFFDANYTNKIDFASAEPQCTADQVAAGGCYYNVGRARVRGVESAISIDIVPSTWLAKLSYTYLDAVDLDKNQQLLRTPHHQGYLALTYRGLPNWEFEPRLLLVGERYDSNGGRVTLPGYVRVDFDNRYKINASNDAYIRFENLTDAHTEDAYNYGSAGRSVYVGWTTRW